MKKLLIKLILYTLIFLNLSTFCKADETRDYKIQMKQDLLTLMMAYPEFIVDIEVTPENKVYCIMKSGKKILYDDKIEKNHEQKLSNPDLQDMLEQYYPLDKTNEIYDMSFDPGRARNYQLLNEVYGQSRESIENNLTSLKYGYTNYQFNSHNNANISLESALKDIMPLSNSRGDIGAILYPASGTYNYRVISGTGLLSPHSFGIAIDLKSDPRDYWKWSSKEKGETRLKEYPSELITAFENNNFVWGGKWGHFDILHFEYRPEIILKAKYFTNWKEGSNWYDGAPSDDEITKNYIELINNAIDPLTVSSSISTKEEYQNLINNLFINRNKSILTQDLDSIESLYDTSTQCGQWAFEYEEAKVKYINNWAQKQGIKFTDIIPNVHIKSSKIHNKTSSFYILCNTEYKYIYEDQPDLINTFRIGTYHCLNLNNKDDSIVISKEWYTDPFADSLKLENIKADEIKEYIASQPYRDLSSINERRQGAIDYATKYCGAASLEEFEHKYNKSYRDFNPEGGDCANFASQILHEGGKFKTNSIWNYDKGSATGPWINADKFTHYMLNSGRASVIAHGSYSKIYKASYKLLPGDFVAYEKKGDITHISTVTSADSKGYPLVTCHNTDRYNVPWDLGWSDKNMNFWLVRVHY